MKPVGRPLKIIAVNLLLFLVLAEGFSLVWFLVDTGNLYYRQQPPLPTAYGTPAPEGELTAHQFHPYFGVSTRPHHRQNSKAVANNLGFFSPHTYPRARKNDREFFIGVFGGSVAEFFCSHGWPTLKAELRKDPAFNNRRPILLNFSRGGWKQPQQLMALSYFLSIGQDLDLVINIDGFNEIALGSRNEQRGIDGSMPSYGHIEALINLIDEGTLSAERLEHLHTITGLRGKLAATGTTYADSQSATAGLFWITVYRHRLGAFTRALHRMDAARSEGIDASLVYLMPAAETLDDRAAAGKALDIWARCSRSMDALCRAHGADYLHVIQPNQYFSSKVFTAKELEQAVDLGTSHAHFVRIGYPLLLDRAERLRREGLPVHSAVEIFDDEPATLFIDSCCHFNRRGNRLLAEFIARKVRGDRGADS